MAPIFAEDLGYITPDVRELMHQFGLPGIRVLQFGFDGDPSTNCHAPHNHVREALVYTGTHDNNTSRGWFEQEATPIQKRRLREYLGYRPKADTISWDLIRLAYQSVACLAIIPMQDVLGLGSAGRMNHPARKRGNWLWRMRPGAASMRLADRLAELTQTCGRL
jgi:4-alpha-glucanotransferase